MNISAFVIASVLFLAGVVLFGYSWDGMTFSPLMFLLGIAAVSASITIPYHLLKRLDG